jgi:antirestriction protein
VDKRKPDPGFNVTHGQYVREFFCGLTRDSASNVERRMKNEEWRIIDKSPITGACLWASNDGTQVAACKKLEAPEHASAWVSGVAASSREFVTDIFYHQYWYEY